MTHQDSNPLTPASTNGNGAKKAAPSAWDRILPFLRPIEPLIRDAGISEIMVNGDGAIFVERRGVVTRIDDVVLEQSTLLAGVKSIARNLGDDVSEAAPILDSRLEDGSRVASVIPPCSLYGITLTIRKFVANRYSVDDLIAMGTLTAELAELLCRCVTQRRNILLSGGTGTGKTTLLNILSGYIPQEDRVVIIEDTAEIQMTHPNLVRFEARVRERPGAPAVPIRALLKATLRHRPDRIVVGEIRDGAAYDLLQALNTGHSGSMSTVHADSATGALQRFASLVLESGVQLPYLALKSNIADALNLIVQIERRHGKRYVSEVVAVEGFNVDDDAYIFQHVYQRPRDQHGPLVVDVADGQAAAVELRVVPKRGPDAAGDAIEDLRREVAVLKAAVAHLASELAARNNSTATH